MSHKKEAPETPIEATPELPIFKETERERHARRLMWIGVISFSVIIFALWGWSVTVQISGLQWNKAPEVALASKTKQEWGDIFAKQKEQAADHGAALEQIKDVMNKLNAASVTAQAEHTTSTATTTNK